MTEISSETEISSATTTAALEAQRELDIQAKNMRWGWALLGLFILLFGGTVGVAYIYLWLS